MRESNTKHAIIFSTKQGQCFGLSPSGLPMLILTTLQLFYLNELALRKW